MGHGFVMQQGIEPIAAQLLLQLPVPRAMFSSRWLFSYHLRMRLRAVGVAMKLSQSRLGCAVLAVISWTRIADLQRRGQWADTVMDAHLLAVITDPRVNAARKGAWSKAAMPLQCIQARRNAQADQAPQNVNKTDKTAADQKRLH
jgi:hypothetical protein